VVFSKIKVVKRFLFFLSSLFIIHYSSFASPTAASEDFIVNQQIVYTYQDSGSGTVTESISLTNRFSTSYARQYHLRLLGTNITSITAADVQGPLPVELTETESGSQVTVQLLHPSAGKDRVTRFTLSYPAPAAITRGQVKEVSIPQISDPSQIENYTLVVKIPGSYGKLAYSSSPPSTSSDLFYTFSKDQLISQPIKLTFGNIQAFNFQLVFHLENSSLQPQLQAVAIPPDTSYQRVFYDLIDPQPINVLPDADGNWLAYFRLPPKSRLDITASGQAHLQNTPQNPSSQSDPLLTSYLQPDQYWPVDHARIQEIAAGLSTPKQVYQYVTSTLKYDTSRLANSARRGVLVALDNPDTSLCTDFTDLFITLARAAGVPAREVNGYAYSTDPQLRPLSLVTDVLHAWPQYWDLKNKTWVDVDPTWESTSKSNYFDQFDFNHFAFVIHGQSSESPLAAGQYKQGSTRDVAVSFAPYRSFAASPLKIEVVPPRQILPFIQNQALVRLTNTQASAIYNPSPVSIIPPFGKFEYLVDFRSSPFPWLTPTVISVSTHDAYLDYNIAQNHYLLWYLLLTIAASVTLIVMVLFAHHAWSVHHERSRWTNPLRR